MTFRRALCCAAAAFLLGANLCGAFPLRVLESKLPKDLAFRKAVEHLGNEIELVDTWHSEWNYSIPKEQVVKEVEELLSTTDSFIRSGGSGLEIRLFRALLKHYLYNLEALHSEKDIVNDLEALKKEFPKDNRPGWLLGVHYMQANRSIEAVNEFEKIVHGAAAEDLDGSLWYDCAEAAYLAAMPSRATWALSNAYGAQRKALLQRDELYKFIEAKRKVPSTNERILSKTLYHATRLEDYVALVSRPFGLWIPLKFDWQAQLGDCENGSTFVALKPTALKSERGTTITYRIGIQCYASNSGSFDSFVAKEKASFKNTAAVTNISAKLPFVAYEWVDPQLYSSVGGGHGYVFFLERAEPPISGLDLERIPNEAKPTQENKVQYFSLVDFYDRFRGRIYYKIILDTCNDIFEGASVEFRWFLDNLIIE